MVVKQQYSLGPIKSGEELNSKAVVELVLKEYGLYVENASMDDDLNNILNYYKDDYFGVVRYKKMIVGTYAIIGLGKEVAEIRKMYLLKEHRGKGLGAKIIEHLIEYAQSKGYKKITLETASVLVEAIGLYRKLGFTEIISKNASPRCDRQFEFSLNNDNK